MSEEPGQEPGQPPAGYSWGDLVDAIVKDHGTLAAVAWKLIDHATGDDVASIERALRRLRGRGQLDGGIWGQRVLRTFGVPTTIEARLRWMGLYQSPFNDLPLALCLDQLRLWDRPPISESRARVWIQLGHASCALRQQMFDEAAQHASSVPDTCDVAARIEAKLVLAYVASKRDDDARVTRLLDAAESLLREAPRDAVAFTLDPLTRACFEARLVDQRAYQLNRAGEHDAALALYEGLPDEDVHPFASYRRDAGRAYGHLRAGRIDRAHELAQLACEHAGDGGYTRLRAMGLILLAKIDPANHVAVERARAIATRLDDRELLVRVDRISSIAAARC